MSESKQELNSFLMKVKEGSGKAGLKVSIQKSEIMAFGLITLWQIDGKQWKHWQILFIYLFSSEITADCDYSNKIKRHFLLRKKSYDQHRQCTKSKDITLSTRVHRVKTVVFPVVMYGCESWTTNRAEHGRTVAFGLWWLRRLKSLLDSKEIKLVNPKGSQTWIFIQRANIEAEVSILSLPDARRRLIGKVPYSGKDWGQKDKVMTEHDMVVWHHRLNVHEFEEAPGNSEGQGSLVCCSPWAHKKLDMI